MQLGKYTLQPYQIKAIQDLRNGIVAGHRKQILSLRTGGGKTLCSAAIMQLALSKGRRSLFLASQRTLITQKSLTLDACGIRHSVLMAGCDYERTSYDAAQVTVASRDTFWSRVAKRKTVSPPPADIVIIDEIHRDTGATMRSICDMYPNAHLIGLTATPGRADGTGIGDGWRIVPGPTHEELVACGRLVDLASPCYAPAPPDLCGVKISTSSKDYVLGELSSVMNKSFLISGAVDNWLKYASDRPTVAFAVDVAHSLAIQRDFNAAGIPWGHVDADTPDDERARIYHDLKTGRLKGISNCNVCTIGWDQPCVSCALLLRPTQSLTLFIQMVGRILRAYPLKKDALILDHAGCLIRHGWPTIERVWPESQDKVVQPVVTSDGKATVRNCPQCAAMWTIGPTCPSCGWKPQNRKDAAAAMTVPGVLVPVTRKTAKKAAAQTTEQKLWMSILAQCANTDRSIAVAEAIFRKRAGKWPRNAGVGPIAPKGQLKLPVAVKWPNFKSSNRRKVR